MRLLFSYLRDAGLENKTELDLTLARGLNYYTGAIIEVKARDVAIGSICGGGRYDNLTGVFGLDGVSGVGVSFGADRIYDVLTQLNLFDGRNESLTRVLILNFGEKEALHAIKIRDRLAEAGVSSEIYPDAVKLKKQISYADSKGIPFIVMAGDEEIRTNLLTVKNMVTGDQKRISPDELPEFLKP